MARPEKDVLQLVRERAQARGVDLDDSVVEELSQDIEERWRDQGGVGAPDRAALDRLLGEVPWSDLRRKPVNLDRRLWMLMPLAVREPARRLWSWLAVGSIERLRGRLLATAAVLILGVGLGAAMAVTRIVEGRRSDASPFGDPQQMLWLWNRDPGAVDGGFSLSELVELEDAAPTFPAAITGFSSKPLTWSGSGDAKFVDAAHVRPNFFEAFEARASQGRTVQPGDEIGPPGVAIVVLSHLFWQVHFGGAPVVGRQLVLDGHPAVVVGVTSEDFRYPAWAQMWVGGSIAPLDDIWRVVAKVGEAAVPAAVATALSRNDTAAVRVVSLADRLEASEKPFWSALVALARAVLWVSCVNLGCIVLAFAVVERKALAIRMTLGASPARIGRRLAAGGLLWGVAAWSVALLVCAAGAEGLSRLMGAPPPSLQGLLRFAAPALAVSVATTLASCLAFQGSREGSLGPVLRGEETRHPRWVRWSWPTAMTVVAASSTLLVLAALLLTGGLLRRSTATSRLSLPHVLSFWIYPPAAEFGDPAARRAFGQAIAERLRRVEDVEAVSQTDNLPWDMVRRPVELSVAGRGEPLRAERIVVGPPFFATLRMEVLRGRNFGPTEERGQETVLVSEALAAQAWPGREALGQKVLLSQDGQGWRTVVGVVEDLPSLGPASSCGAAAVYLPLDDHDGHELAFVARTSRPADTVRPDIARAVSELAPDLPLRQLRTAHEFQDDLLENHRVLLRVASFFASLSILASWLGLLVVTDAWTREQRRELAIRQAMGASRGDVARQVGWRNARAIFLGVAFGCAAGLIGVRIIEAAIVGARLLEPGVLLAALAVILLGAGWACVFSARRSARIDPVGSLRS